MAEKLQVIAQLVLDSSDFNKGVDAITKTLQKAKEIQAEIISQFGENSDEAKKAAASVSEIEKNYQTLLNTTIEVNAESAKIGDTMAGVDSDVQKVNASVEDLKVEVTKTDDAFDNVNTTVNTTNDTVVDLTAQLKNAKVELENIVNQFGEGSNEAKAAADNVQQIEQKMKEAAIVQIDEPVKSLKAQLREANNELQAAVDKFGVGSKEAAEAAKRVAQLKDTIGDAKTLTDAFNPDAKFKGLANAVQGAVGAVTALQGAQALFGEQSKEVQETLVKVQGALALSQGVNSVLEAKDSFKALGSQAADAFKAIKTGIGATGIGLLVIALGTIVAYWDDITAAVSGVSEEQKKLNKETESNLKANEDKLASLENQDQQLKAQGKSEKEILQLKVKQTDEAIKAAEINLENAKATKNAQVEASKRNRDILQGIITFITAPITALLKGIDLIGEAIGKNLNLANKFTGGIAELIFDPKEVAAEGDKAIAEAEKRLNGLKEKRAGLQNNITAIDKQAADKRAADAKTAEEKAKAAAEKAAKEAADLAKRRAEFQIGTDKLIQQARLDNLKDGLFKQKALLDQAYDDDIAALLASLDKKEIDQEEYNKRRLALDAKYQQDSIALQKSADEKAAVDKFNKDLANLEQQINNNDLAYQTQKKALDDELLLLEAARAKGTLTEQQYKDAVKKNSEDRTRIYQIELNTRKQQVAAFGKLLTDISDLVGKNTKAGKAAAVAGLVIQQAQTVAQVTTDTIASTRAIVKKYAGIPGGQIPAAVEIGLNVAQGAVAIAKAVQAVKKGISEIKGANESSNASGSADVGAGGGAAAAAPIAAQQETTALPQEQINQLASANATVRAYVVESDVTGNQERITRLNRAARIS